VKWKIYRSFPIQFVSFGYESVAFHHGSGETHYLDKDTSLVLSIISGSEFAISEPELLSIFIDSEGNLDKQSLNSVLDQLCKLKIIESI